MTPSPIHAEVRAALYPFLPECSNTHQGWQCGENDWICNWHAEQLNAMCQAVADALLAGLPEKFNPKLSESAEEYSGKEWYNQAIDDVTRVIGELGGRRNHKL